jgi:hypothetical protein
MTWEALSSARAADGAAVLITSSAGSRMPPLLSITLRLDRLPAVPFKVGGSAQVLFGRGEHTGRLRIVPGAGSKFLALGRGNARRALSLRGRLPAGIKPAKRGPDAARHEVLADGGIEIRLPEWATPAEPPKPPYVGVTQRVPDPAAPLRGARR